MQWCVFSKHLQDYDYRKLGGSLKSIGFEAVDLTVRPGGHVEPEAVKDKLPEAAAILKGEGVSIAMITTAITAIDQPYTRDVLETAAHEGIRFFKFGYYKNLTFGGFRQGLAETKAEVKKVSALAKELGIWGGFHNHGGAYVGASLGHVRELLEGLDADAVGAFYDVGHATVEGTYMGWLIGLEDVADRVRMVALKDLAVNVSEGKVTRDTVALGEGLVRWKQFVAALKTLEAQIGPVSFHSEYDRPADEVLQLAQRDRIFFAELWNATTEES